MPIPTDLGHISALAGQGFEFMLKLTALATYEPALTGMVLKGQIRSKAKPSTPLVIPTIADVTVEIVGLNAVATTTVSVTEEQMASLPCKSDNFTTPTSYVLDIEGAYSDAPTDFEFRLIGSIDIYQGGIMETPTP